MKWTVEAKCNVVDDEHDTTNLERHLDRVMEALLDLDADPDIGATLGTGTVEVEVTVDADDLEEAFFKGLTTIRTAFHTAGASTHGWPSHADVMANVETKDDGHWVVNLVGTEMEQAELVDA